MSITTVTVRSFRRVVVTAGRKRREGEDDIEADIDIEGEADSDDTADVQTAVGYS